MTRLYEHLEQVLEYIDFRDRTGGGHLMARIRRLFNRALLDQNEMNILRGMLTAVQARRRPAGSGRTPGRSGDRRDRLSPAIFLFCTAVNTAPDLPRLRGHDAGRSARRRRDDRVPAPERRARQSVVGRPRVRTARPRARREGAGAGRRRRSARARTASSGLPARPSPTTSRSSASRASTPIAAGTSCPPRTEHKAVLDPLKQLEREGFEVTWLKPAVRRHRAAGAGAAMRCAPTRSSSRSCT